MLARDLAKARDGLNEAQSAARAEAVADNVKLGTYDQDMERAVAEADLIFETLAEDLALKQTFFERVDNIAAPIRSSRPAPRGFQLPRWRADAAIRSASNFLGIHLFNPPHMIAGTEVVPHSDTDPAVTAHIVEMLRRALGRKVIVTRDRAGVRRKSRSASK